MTYTCRYPSPLGGIAVSADETGLTGLWFEKPNASTAPANLAAPSLSLAEADLPVFAEAKKWLDIYFSGEAPDFTPPLSLAGTPFRQTVWKLLLTIPYGRTMTYGEIAVAVARQMGKEKMSAQAVGGAVGHNPISIIVPCHRVVGANGDLTGYGGGLERKIGLLTLEKADMSQFYLPKKPRSSRQML